MKHSTKNKTGKWIKKIPNGFYIWIKQLLALKYDWNSVKN